jgi:acyl-homoserine lactone acylase PvdQ
MRLLAIYTANQAALDEVETRLTAWMAGGAEAASGVDTFYHSADGEADDSVATMIFNEWWKKVIAATFEDEGMAPAFGPDVSTSITRAMYDLYRGRGAGNPAGLQSWNVLTSESVFFDDLGTAEVESSHEVSLSALAAALSALAADPDPEVPGVGGFGSTDMNDWRWGLRHLVKFESVVASFVGTDPAFALLANGFSITPETLPLAPDLEATDPRATLPWFPRPGDLFNVDAGHYNPFGDDYFYANGPVMRMVVRLEEGNISGVNILPGGQSGLTDSNQFDDQVQLWLANETVPLRFHVADVVAGATSRETYAPMGD